MAIQHVTLPHGRAVHGLDSGVPGVSGHVWFDAAGRAVHACALYPDGAETVLHPRNPAWARLVTLAKESAE